MRKFPFGLVLSPESLVVRSGSFIVTDLWTVMQLTTKVSGLRTHDSRARYSPIFLMYSATSASRNRPSGLPAAAAWRTAVAEAG